ncbi:hypothetical protein MLD38_033093 [Melastoma candidum]|uniref:Uncharacterized protein n=1 Tax=Melastoma candidum TaxID=119954 RepID=A0ACB9MA04_9MYRT|nr:hypothetical protein MLD38_033093 [Melastoma candidum]
MPAACEVDRDDDDLDVYEDVASSSRGSSPDYGSRLLFGKPPPLPLDRDETNTSSSSSSTLLSRAEPIDAVASSIPAYGCQVVGWPPIRAHRTNPVISHAKTPPLNGEFRDVDLKTGRGSYYVQGACPRTSVYVKVNMDGVPIGRKIDLNSHRCYQSLANALESMFSWSTGVKSKRETRLSKLLDGSSGYVLTYEDTEGDWLLVGDVPWGCSSTR